MASTLMPFLDVRDALRSVAHLDIQSADFDYGDESGDIQVLHPRTRKKFDIQVEISGSELFLLVLQMPWIAQRADVSKPQAILRFVKRIADELEGKNRSPRPKLADR